MTFFVAISDAAAMFPEYTFVRALTPSAQKAAFHVRDSAGIDLCLKIIAPNNDIDRVDREIQALQSIKHQNVVRLLEYTFSSRPGHHRHFMIEEFVDGCDLSHLIGDGQILSTSSAAALFRQLFSGLSELRKQSIVHRDLKPSNVRVRSNNSPVIIDFGLARLLNLSDLTKTSHGAAIGTPRYFAPEQFVGTKRDIDHRTDMFAAGILLYEALVGLHPFYTVGMSYDDLSDAVCKSQRPFLAPAFISLPKEWKILVKRLLEKERSRRPHDAAQVESILSRIDE